MEAKEGVTKQAAGQGTCSLDVGFPAWASRQHRPSLSDVLTVPTCISFQMRRHLLCAGTVTRLRLRPHPATWQVRSPLLASSLSLHCYKEPASNSPVPSPVHCHVRVLGQVACHHFPHITYPHPRSVTDHLCHILLLRSKSEVPSSFRKRELHQMGVCLPRVPHEGR